MPIFGCCLPSDEVLTQKELGTYPHAGDRTLVKMDLLQKAGYDYAELGCSYLNTLGEDDVSVILRGVQQTRFPVYACNSFIPSSFSLFCREQQKELSAYVERTVRLCAGLGVKVIAFGSGSARNFPEDMSREKAEDTYVRFLDSLSRLAAAQNVQIVLEPLRGPESRVWNKVSETAEFVRSHTWPHISVMADVFHMAWEQEDLSVIGRERNLLDHVHLAVPGSRVCPGPSENHPYLLSFLDSLRGIGYDKGMSLECSFADFRREIIGARTFLTRVFGDRKTSGGESV